MLYLPAIGFLSALAGSQCDDAIVEDYSCRDWHFSLDTV